MIAAINWTDVLVSLIAGLPAIIAAIGVLLVHQQIRTPSGKKIGEVAEFAHDTGIANNLMLTKLSGETKPAERADLRVAEENGPQVPAEGAGAA